MMENMTGLNKNSLLNWDLDETGCLTIYGTGSMPNFSCGENPEPPWYEKREQIRKVCISEGITRIGIKAFEGCSALEEAELPETLERILSYAFRDCVSLKEIQSKKKEFRYIYDENPGSPRETVLFGLEAFRNTPWAAERWGDFYCEEGVLYTCFSRKDHLTIPEGVHTLYEFSLANLGNLSVTLPETLTTIGEFAFSGTAIKELLLPESVETISPYAFADSVLELVEFPRTMSKTLGFARTEIMPAQEAREGKKEKLCSVPDLYKVELADRKNMGKFKALRVVRKNAEHCKDGTVKPVYGRNCVAVGKSMYRRIRAGSVLLCVGWENDRLDCVRSFEWDDHGAEGKSGLVSEYRMYPVLKDGMIDVREDSFVSWKKSDVEEAFGDLNGRQLAEEGILRTTEEGKQEEWFWSNERENFGGPLELRLLKYWRDEHPQVKIDSDGEADSLWSENV